jgi:hypothetical protein
MVDKVTLQAVPFKPKGEINLFKDYVLQYPRLSYHKKFYRYLMKTSRCINIKKYKEEYVDLAYFCMKNKIYFNGACRSGKLFGFKFIDYKFWYENEFLNEDYTNTKNNSQIKRLY